VSRGESVRAAGGIVQRTDLNGESRVLLVHRPRYDDWSLPKGKADNEESDEETALREVEEETGLRCLLVEEIGETRYRDSKGRAKVVRYWLMVPEPPAPGAAEIEFAPNDEVDDIRWCTMAEAHQLLTYSHDRRLVRSLDRRV
jgi:8-oxo-dGTP diphosphatase